MMSEIPTEIELKKKKIVCPSCQAEIEIDMTIDITQITDIIRGISNMDAGEPEGEDE
jgi:hypothetical protein